MADARTPSLLREDYWLVLSRPLPSTTAADIAALVDEHLAWLLVLESDGKILMSGPFLEGPAVGPGSGITVLRADSAEEASRLASQDPFVVAGLRTFDTYRWQLNEGSIGITVSLGTGTYTWH
ncbi:YciI family protein [Streptomyces mirabilis]|uniref:YciI family protein n=1 Tax=Streptomyces mirabilis TaxID=68239 RepID=UPI00332C5F3F